MKKATGFLSAESVRGLIGIGLVEFNQSKGIGGGPGKDGFLSDISAQGTGEGKSVLFVCFFFHGSQQDIDVQGFAGFLEYGSGFVHHTSGTNAIIFLIQVRGFFNKAQGVLHGFQVHFGAE